MVTKKEIVEMNYDLSHSIYKEKVHIEQRYCKPSAIIKKLNRIEQKIQTELESLKNLYE